MMRIVVAVLAVLAGAKVWTQDQIYRTATEDALVAAYRAKAIDSCQRSAVSSGNIAGITPAQRALAEAFAKPSAAHLEIGNPDIDVKIWDVDHAAWQMRYKYPYIVLEAGAGRPSARCSYDVTLQKAVVTTL